MIWRCHSRENFSPGHSTPGGAAGADYCSKSALASGSQVLTARGAWCARGSRWRRDTGHCVACVLYCPDRSCRLPLAWWPTCKPPLCPMTKSAWRGMPRVSWYMATPLRPSGQSTKTLTTYELLPYSVALSIGLFGSNDFAVRLPAAVFGTLAIFVIFYIGMQLWGCGLAFWPQRFMPSYPFPSCGEAMRFIRSKPNCSPS